MTYLFASVFLLFIPGYCIVRLVDFRRFRFLLSLSISYALFVMVLKLTQISGGSYGDFKISYLLALLVVIAAVVAKQLLRGQGWSGGFQLRGTLAAHHQADTVAVLSITLATSVYFLIAGPYLELPSDVFQHMEYVQKIREILTNSEQTGQPMPAYFLGLNGKYWHYFYVFVNDIAGRDVSDSIGIASMFNVLVFLLAVYLFTKIVFAEFSGSTAHLSAIALVTTAFYFLHFGVNVFAFVRYYAMAPVILNMVLYFTVMAIAIQFFRESRWKWKEITFAAILLFIAAMIHRQEALYVVVMILLMSGYLLFNSLLNNQTTEAYAVGGNRRIGPLLKSKPALVFLPLAAATLSLHVYSFMKIARRPVEEPKLIPLENLLPFIKNLYILNPTYQFYYVLTVWGLAVIALFVIYRKRLSGNAFNIAGMDSPLFTIFNPVFVDLFLRHSHSILLWRLSSLVPIYFIAGFLLVEAYKMIRTGGVLRIGSALVTLVLLIGLLFPISNTYIKAPYSRLVTLKPVDPNTSPEQWQDLLNYLDLSLKHISEPTRPFTLSSMTSSA